MNYYISDLHFFCKNLFLYAKPDDACRRYDSPEEMHEEMKTRWNAKITNGDHVYILGDISMKGRKEALIALLAQLKGRKHLIEGNHDDTDDYRLKKLFEEICPYKELWDSANKENYKVILCHYPILMWNGQHHGSILLYGHTHQTVEEDFFRECLRQMNEDPSIRHEGEKEFRAYNVGCMLPYMDYEPKTLKEIMASATEKKVIL